MSSIASTTPMIDGKETPSAAIPCNIIKKFSGRNGNTFGKGEFREYYRV